METTTFWLTWGPLGGCVVVLLYAVRQLWVTNESLNRENHATQTHTVEALRALNTGLERIIERLDLQCMIENALTERSQPSVDRKGGV